MNVAPEFKNIKSNLSEQQSTQLNDLYQEIMFMTQELDSLKKNNQSLQEKLSQKKNIPIYTDK